MMPSVTFLGMKFLKIMPTTEPTMTVIQFMITPNINLHAPTENLFLLYHTEEKSQEYIPPIIEIFIFFVYNYYKESLEGE